MTKLETCFYVVGTPIGNLGEMSLRAIDILKSVEIIFCEDTRHSLKLLNHFQISKPLRSAPYFKENQAGDEILSNLRLGKKIAFITDAGMPGVSDPGAKLVGLVREAGFKIEVIGGVSSLTSFIAGLGRELESFRFVGFLPSRTQDRKKFFSEDVLEPTIFFESPHRIEGTLDLIIEIRPESDLGLGKEISKISEAFYLGKPSAVKAGVRSFKGEWIGCLFPTKVERKNR